MRDYQLKMDGRPDDQILTAWLFSSMFTLAVNDGKGCDYFTLGVRVNTA